MHICNVTRESELKLYIIILLWWFFLVQDSHFSSMIRTILKQASCPSEKILSHGHLFMNRAHFTKCLMFVTMSTEWVTRRFGLNVRRRLDSDTCGARTTPIPSKCSRASSVGKTSSFSFCQVDMYANLTLSHTQTGYTLKPCTRRFQVVS